MSSARPVPRLFLERVSRALLVRLLAAHASVLLDRHAFSLDALAATAQTDRAQVDVLWRLLSAPPPELAPLRDDLLAVADVATAAGHEILLARDTARALDHELGAEDCAATARLDHRALFDMARPQTAGQSQTKSFASYQSAAPRPLPDDPTRQAEFERLMRAKLAAAGRTDHFKVHEWRNGSERHMEMVYGKLATARDLLGKIGDGRSHDVTAQVTDRTTERAHLVFHDDTLRLDVAGYDWMKETVRSFFGEAFFGTAEHFRGGDTITLAPLENLDAALSAEGVPGLKSAHLVAVSVDLGGPNHAWAASGASNDCMNGPSAEHALRQLADGIPVEATFHLILVGRTRPLTLKIAVTKGRLEFERRDPRVVRVVRDWVVARGYMSVPEHLRARESDAPGAQEPNEPSEIGPS